jgi:LacI family transcriptional regulator
MTTAADAGVHRLSSMSPTRRAWRLVQFHASILEQLSRRLRTAGRALLAYCHNDERASISHALDFFAAHRVDCLVMDGHDEASEGVRELLSGGTPVIFYDNDVPGLPVDRVMIENQAATARAVGHLLDIGHTRVAVLSGSTRNSAGRQRPACCSCYRWKILRLRSSAATTTWRSAR